MFGTYHHWSKKHLHRYLSEFDFRFNHRTVSDGERTVAAIKSIGGKRLRYAAPVKQAKTEVLTIDQMADLYLDGNETLKAIADRLGITRQAVQERLATAKVKRRKAGWAQSEMAPKELLVNLYLTKQWTRSRIAEELKISTGTLRKMFHAYGIETRPWKRNDIVKYPQLEKLEVGESVIIEMDQPLRKYYAVNFYGMAERLGIKLSCKRLSDRTVRVTRKS